MSKELTYDERKEWAKMLYIRLGYSAPDVALEVNVEEAIVRQWIKAHAWNDVKTSLLLSKESQLQTLYGQLEKLTHDLNGELLKTKDVDQYSKCIIHINALQPFPSISDIIEVFDLFLIWLRKKDVPLTQQVTVYLDAFLEQRLAA